MWQKDADLNRLFYIKSLKYILREFRSRYLLRALFVLWWRRFTIINPNSDPNGNLNSTQIENHYNKINVNNYSTILLYCII